MTTFRGTIVPGLGAVAKGDAVDINIEDTGLLLDATNVETALAELATELNIEEAALLSHIADTTDAHAASAITNTPAGTIVAATVQAAIDELDTEKASLAGLASTANGLGASLIGIEDAAADFTAGDVEGALVELQAEKAPLLNPAITGGSGDGYLIKHGDAVKAFYRYSSSNPGVASYRKIASLPINDASNGSHLRLRVHVDGGGSTEAGSFDVVISNRTTVVERVISLSGSIARLTAAGIKTYTETDTSLSVYIYDTGTTWLGVSVELVSVGWYALATIIPPNDVVSITTPTGTLSLDTTSGKYANGVPDGNEDWKTPTLLNSWVSVTSYRTAYRKHSNGLVEVEIAVRAGIDNTIVFNLPAGYRPNIAFQVPAAHSVSGEWAYVFINTGGDLYVNVSTSTTNNTHTRFTFMAEG